MPSKEMIMRQVEGLPLVQDSTTKISYILKSKGGHNVMSFDMHGQDRAKREAASRGLKCFRITTIEEPLNV